jgi:hypothetical protein
MTFSAKLLVSLAAHALVATTLLAGGAHAQGFHTNGTTPDSCSAGTAWNYTAKRCEDEPTPGTTGLADAMEAYGKAQREHKPLPFTVPPVAPVTTACPVGPATTTVAACAQAMQRAGWTPCGDTGAMCPPSRPVVRYAAPRPQPREVCVRGTTTDWGFGSGSVLVSPTERCFTVWE